MTSASLAGRYHARSRFDPAPRRQRPVARPRGVSTAAIVVSFMAHGLLVLGLVAMIVWNAWHTSKVYYVNLVPAVAAVGSPTAPADSPPVPARPAPVLPSRAPAPTPAPEPRDKAPREAPRLPEAALPKPSLPSRAVAPLRPGEKELPSLANPTTAARVDKPQSTARPAESQAAPPPAPRGLPTGSPAGVGARSLEASDFPYAWYLRQVQQKIEGAWQRQNHLKEPNQRPSVVFEIRRDGSIGAPRIQDTSGNTLYDQAALRAILEASPFPPLPEGWPKPSLVLGMKFELEMTRN